MRYYDTYDYLFQDEYSSIGGTALMAVLMVYLVVFLIWGIYALVCYILKGIGLYTIAKRQGADYPWLAFVPFARTYLHGELGGPIALKKRSVRNPGIWLLALPFIQGAVMMVFYLIFWAVGLGVLFSAYSTYDYYTYGNSNMAVGAGTIGTMILLFVLVLIVALAFSAVLQVLKVLVNHQILEKFTTKNMSIAHAILAGIIPLYEPICLFIMSRKPYNPGMEPNVGTPFMQAPPEGPNPYMGGPAPEGPVPPQNVPNPESGFVPQRGLLNPEQVVTPKPEEPVESELPNTKEVIPSEPVQEVPVEPEVTENQE